VIDADNFSIFRVNLEERSDYVPQQLRKSKHTNYISTIKEKYQIAFQMLDIEKFDSTCLSEFHVYLLVSPVTFYLWLGKEIEEDVRVGALSIIKAFCKVNMPERWDI
jgi:hypothetical protein